ncbi:MAG: CBS domain-containing protein [Candidatus Caldarchaeum sp.]|nr:CBS domain-containing protein [Candidatus Caldarchaeum sp.]
MWQVGKVRDVVRAPLITVEGHVSIIEAAKVMAEHKISGVVVTHNGEPKGLITERDIVAKVVAAGRDPAKTKALEVMSTPLITIDIEASLLEAVDLMNRKKVRRLIVTEEDRVVGLFTIRDVISLSRVCAYCGKPIKPYLPSQPSAEADVVVECSCGAVYMMECAKTVVYCIYCSRKLVAEVYYPAPEDTFSG